MLPSMPQGLMLGSDGLSLIITPISLGGGYYGFNRPGNPGATLNGMTTTGGALGPDYLLGNLIGFLRSTSDQVTLSMSGDQQAFMNQFASLIVNNTLVYPGSTTSLLGGGSYTIRHFSQSGNGHAWLATGSHNVRFSRI